LVSPLVPIATVACAPASLPSRSTGISTTSPRFSTGDSSNDAASADGNAATVNSPAVTSMPVSMSVTVTV